MSTKEIEVQILGKDFIFNIPKSIRSEEFLEIVNFVESKLKKIKGETADLDSFRLGLLTSINIAEEYFSLKKENEKLKTFLDKIDKMISTDGEESHVSISFSS